MQAFWGIPPFSAVSVSKAQNKKKRKKKGRLTSKKRPNRADVCVRCLALFSFSISRQNVPRDRVPCLGFDSFLWADEQKAGEQNLRASFFFFFSFSFFLLLFLFCSLNFKLSLFTHTGRTGYLICPYVCTYLGTLFHLSSSVLAQHLPTSGFLDKARFFLHTKLLLIYLLTSTNNKSHTHASRTSSPTSLQRDLVQQLHPNLLLQTRPSPSSDSLPSHICMTTKGKSATSNKTQDKQISNSASTALFCSSTNPTQQQSMCLSLHIWNPSNPPPRLSSLSSPVATITHTHSHTHAHTHAHEHRKSSAFIFIVLNIAPMLPHSKPCIFSFTQDVPFFFFFFPFSRILSLSGFSEFFLSLSRPFLCFLPLHGPLIPNHTESVRAFFLHDNLGSEVSLQQRDNTHLPHRLPQRHKSVAQNFPFNQRASLFVECGSRSCI